MDKWYKKIDYNCWIYLPGSVAEIIAPKKKQSFRENLRSIRRVTPYIIPLKESKITFQIYSMKWTNILQVLQSLIMCVVFWWWLYEPVDEGPPPPHF